MFATAGTALAFWTGSFSGNSAAQADSLSAGNQPSLTTLSGSSVTITWTASTAVATGGAVSGYTINRYSVPSGGTATPATGGCAGTVAALTCTESSVPAGSWYYTVTPHLDAWIGAESPRSNAITISAPALTFTTQPTSGANIQATGTGTFNVSVAVQIGGVTQSSDNATAVTLAINNNAGPGGLLTCANAGGTGPVTVFAGIANFTGCAITKTGTGYTLTATSNPSDTPPTNANSFNITGGTATQIVFTTQPGGATAINSNFTPQPVVKAEDTNGNVATTYTTAVTMAKNAGTGNLVGCTSSSTVAGVASFSGCQWSQTGSGDSIKATSGSFTAISKAFDITGSANAIAFTTEPSASAAAGVAFGTQPAVSVEDSSGRVITADSSSTVVLSIGSGGASGATLGCTSTLTVQVSYGVASFVGCSIDKSSGSAYILHAVDGGHTTNSNGVTVSAGAPASLSFSQQPSTTATGGAAFGTQPQVTVKDALGNLVTSSPVALAVTSGSGGGAGGTLTCTANTVNTNSSGIAGFASCSINTASATAYTLTATDGSATGTSNGITVSVGTASKFVVSAPATANAGSSFGGITLTAEDAGNNLVTSYSGTHTITWSGAATSPGGNAPGYPTSSVSFNNGLSTTALSATLFAAGSNTLTATASPVVGSTTLTVSAGTAAGLSFANATVDGGSVTVSCTGTVGSTSFACTPSSNSITTGKLVANVALIDQYQNRAVNSGSTVTVSLTQSGGSITPSSLTIANGASTSSQTFTETISIFGSGTVTANATVNSTSVQAKISYTWL